MREKTHSINLACKKTGDNTKILDKRYTMGNKGKVDKMVVLACEECKERNYTTTKNKKTLKERMELKKHCPRCNKHTVHKETK